MLAVTQRLIRWCSVRVPKALSDENAESQWIKAHHHCEDSLRNSACKWRLKAHMIVYLKRQLFHPRIYKEIYTFFFKGNHYKKCLTFIFKGCMIWGVSQMWLSFRWVLYICPHLRRRTWLRTARGKGTRYTIIFPNLLLHPLCPCWCSQWSVVGRAVHPMATSIFSLTTSVLFIFISLTLSKRLASCRCHKTNVCEINECMNKKVALGAKNPPANAG